MNAFSARGDGESLDISNSVLRNKLKVAFLEQEKAEILSRIKDLEATVAINKQLIRDLCDTSFSQSAKYKSAIQKLNDENLKLHQTVKTLVKNKSDYDGKKLISAQVIAEYKRKEEELVFEWKEKVAELRDQLNKKEYLLQVEEKRYQDMENLVMKYLKNIPEVKSMILQIRNFPKSNVGISNVVIENQQLQAKVSDLTTENTRLKKELESSEVRVLVCTLKEKIGSLIKENEKQRKKLEEQERHNMELYELNEKLTTQLENVNKQVNVLIHSQKIMQTEVFHTYNKDPPHIYYTQEVQPNKKNMSFGELSSISDHMFDDPQEEGNSMLEGQGNAREAKSIGDDDLRVEIDAKGNTRKA